MITKLNIPSELMRQTPWAPNGGAIPVQQPGAVGPLLGMIFFPSMPGVRENKRTSNPKGTKKIPKSVAARVVVADTHRWYVHGRIYLGRIKVAVSTLTERTHKRRILERELRDQV
jgi:hypothetical protein